MEVKKLAADGQRTDTRQAAGTATKGEPSTQPPSDGNRESIRSHVVILDINIPVMDGYEAATAIRKESSDPELVLVAHTSLKQPDDVERVKRAGCDHYVNNPP